MECLYTQLPFKHFGRLCFRIHRRNQNQLRPHQTFRANAFGVMPIEADHNPDFPIFRIEYMKPVIGGCIVILLIKLLRLRNMHHLLHARNRAVLFNQQAGIVCPPVFVKQNIRHNQNPVFLRRPAKCRHNLRIKRNPILRHILSGVLRKKFRQLHLGKQNQIRPVFCRLLDCPYAFFQVRSRLSCVCHLAKCDFHVASAPFSFVFS